MRSRPLRFGVSPALVDSAIAQGAQAAKDVDFTAVLDQRLFKRHLAILLAAAAVLVAAGVGVAALEPMAIWFNRNVLLGDRAWPQDTYLLVKGAQDGRLYVLG